MKTYLFYDLETSGLNKSFDQVLQFAAIRTDENLNEISEHEIIVKLRPDVIPSPRATMTHRISIERAMTGLCEFEAMSKIHELLNEPGTISIGYNTLGFDDEFLRFSFHRNLLTPYTHQYAKGCGRMDLLPITVMYRLFKSGVINWPENDGVPNIKLENISELNSLASGPAHDAMVDVRATIALAKRFIAEREMWEYLIGYFNKDADKKRINQLPRAFDTVFGIHTGGLVIGTKFGHEMNYQAPVISIGNSIPYSNQSLWLRLDSPELSKTTEESIAENTWVIRKRFGEPDIILPPAERFVKYLSPERKEIVNENVKWLQSHADMFNKIIMHHRQFEYGYIPGLDPDAALYQNGFMSKIESELARQFHNAPFDHRVKIAERFPTPGTKDLACRILWRNYPENLPENISGYFREYMEKVNPGSDDLTLTDFRNDKRTTPRFAMDDIEAIRKETSLDPQQVELFDELEMYIKERFV